jgi:hypothetical protein
MLRLSIYQGKSDSDKEHDKELAGTGTEGTAVDNVDVSIGGAPYSDRNNDPSCDPGEKKEDAGIFDPNDIGESKVVGIDFDGTLALNPEFFAGLMSKIREAGGKCLLITGRPESEKERVQSVLDPAGIKFDEEHYFPSEYTLEQYFADSKNWDEKLGEWKVGVISKTGVDIMIDDTQIIIDLIEKELPDVLVLQPTLEKE